ncbi:uncharacterized protein M421DRAFT_412760 [Didymella exigua CBS 183.55]|uniref:Uncharacterized protein n=1 Tax=Didymella exigua CBS 183.55 TaxID=1150837 RepID=A0A6A5RU01_9PLEO|nr:uncharacterized protein M421DRAFT_412760 [Didymella exigua CBS 183.55]KAF1930498.1 hypothetical protein M421DRAFT_412760 [Didymella exigua CBS 183.55]
MSDMVIPAFGWFTEDGLKTKSISWAQSQFPMSQSDGISSSELLSDENGDDIKKLTRRRQIGDKHTWMLELDTTGVTIPDMPVTVYESTTFRLKVPTSSEADTSVAHYKVDYDESLKHPVLKYRVFGDHNHLQRNSYSTRKCEELQGRLNELNLIELMKIPVGQRPPQYTELLLNMRLVTGSRGKFDLAPTWTFYDDEVIEFLDKAWKVQQRIDEREEAQRRAKSEELI